LSCVAKPFTNAAAPALIVLSLTDTDTLGAPAVQVVVDGGGGGGGGGDVGVVLGVTPPELPELHVLITLNQIVFVAPCVPLAPDHVNGVASSFRHPIGGVHGARSVAE
jgi:hypothetical protein